MRWRPAAHWSGTKSVWRCNIHRVSPRRALSATQGVLDAPPTYYITTPIFYPNSDPHIGHLYSTIVADIFARYAHLKTPSRPVVFVTGTDEHGTKIQKAAHDQGLEGREQEFCDGISMRFRDLARKSSLTHTRFIRTTEKDHEAAVRHLWRELDSRGYIYKGIHSGWYSVSDECFYTSSQVYSKTNPETGEPCMVSMDTGNIVEWSEEENYKFRLSAFRERLLERYVTDDTAIMFHEQLKYIRGVLAIPENVNDISISRPSTRLKWGITVPNDPQHVIYVWLDALTAYLTAVGYPWQGGVQEGLARGWPPDVQVIGKDILRFHTIYFPAFLMALDLPLPKTVLSHAHWTMNQMKMSKSIGNVADPFKVLEEFETDVVRYYLARVGGRFRADNDWSETQLIKHHQELLSLVGNQLSRAFAPKILDRLLQDERYISIKREIFIEARRGNPMDMMPRREAALVPPWNLPLPGAGVHASLQKLAPAFQALMDRLEVAEALEEIVRCLRLSNYEYSSVAPWKPETSVATVSRLLSYTRESLRICGILLQPFIPTKSSMLLDALGVPSGQRTLADAALGVGERPGSMPVQVQRPMLFRPFNQIRRQKGETGNG